MGEGKKPCKECGEVHVVAAVEVMREKLRKTVESGVCKWCGMKLDRSCDEGHVIQHVQVDISYLLIGVLREAWEGGKEG